MIHLHGHSYYSILDGLNSPKQIVDKAIQLSMPAIALTEHGNLNSAFKFYNYAREKGIKPILGMEAYFVPDYLEKIRGYHLTLLAKNYEGFQNLLKLNNLANKEGFYYSPRINLEYLSLYSKNLICLTGCLGGVLNAHILKKTDQEEPILQKLYEIFSKDLYIEIQNHYLPEQQVVMPRLIELAKKYELKLVATNDFHYVSKEDSGLQEIIMADQMGRNLSDQKYKPSGEGYIKSYAEMLKAFNGETSYIQNTYEVSEKINIEFPKFKYLLPEIGKNSYERLELDCYNSLGELGLIENKKYTDRLEMELRVIKEANLTDYFLIVADYILFARQKGILVGPGRGSVGGCLVGYLLGIHNVDPIKYNLYFSRFYNAGRKGSLPDIDIDFMESRVDEIKEYLHQKYQDSAQIGTFGKMAPKGALKTVCRVLEIPFAEANQFSNMVDSKSKTLLDNLSNPKFKKEYDENPYFKEYVDTATKIEGVVNTESIHAAGVFISPVPLDEIVPLRMDRKSGLSLPVCSWDMDDVEKRGLVKLDLLSLNTLDIIADTIKSANLDPDFNNIPLDDSAIFNKISKGDWVGVFQLSDSMSKMAQSMGIHSIYDIATLVALHRPGPLKSGIAKTFLDRRNGREDVTFRHEKLKTILKDTSGVIIFQEQIIAILIELGNFEENEADTVRKIIGKKLFEKDKKYVAEFESLGEKFVKGCEANNLDAKSAKLIWNEIYEFSGYGFNLSHATGYGLITYYTAWLKHYYPEEFMAACFNNSIGNPEKIRMFLTECSRLGLKVKPPSVNTSGYKFQKESSKCIVYGLGVIKGLSDNIISKILAKQKKSKFKSFADFFKWTEADKKSLTVLAEAGALDEFGINRRTIIENIDNLLMSHKKYKINNRKGLIALLDEEFVFNFVLYEEYPQKELLKIEHERLGAFLTYDPYLEFRNLILEKWPQESLEEIEDEINGYLAGVVVGKEVFITKTTKKTMCNMVLENEFGPIKVVVFPQRYQTLPSNLDIGNVIVFDGTFKKEENTLTFFVNRYIGCLN